MTMPVPPADPAPAPADPAPAPAPAAPDPAPTPAPAPSAPKWEGDFDPERAARLVENLRNEIKDLKAKAAPPPAPPEPAQPADIETRLADVTRRLAISEAVRKHGLSDAAAELLDGLPPDQIESRAAKLAALVPAQPAAEQKLPETLPIPGNGTEPMGVSTAQLTRAQFDALSPQERMTAYREGRTRDLGGR